MVGQEHIGCLFCAMRCSSFLRIQRWRKYVLAPELLSVWWWNQTHQVNWQLLRHRCEWSCQSSADGDWASLGIFRTAFPEKSTLIGSGGVSWRGPHKQVRGGEKKKNIFLNVQMSERERYMGLFLLPFRKWLLNTSVNTQMNEAVSFCSSLFSLWLAHTWCPHSRCSGVLHRR